MVNVNPPALTMERLFSPCTRYRDIAERTQQGGLEELTGQPEELNLDVTTEEFLSADRAFTYADLYDMVENGNTILWLTPHASIVRAEGTAQDYYDLMNCPGYESRLGKYYGRFDFSRYIGSRF
jgi:hypothetical protein